MQKRCAYTTIGKSKVMFHIPHTVVQAGRRQVARGNSGAGEREEPQQKLCEEKAGGGHGGRLAQAPGDGYPRKRQRQPSLRQKLCPKP